MIRNLVAFIFLVVIYPSLFGQDYDQNYFRIPVNHPIRLSGSFGELRTNHFHLGIDIKSSKGRSGDPILAAADGYVSRISVDASGFGNAIYIDHDNGYTTVYAHLSALSDTLSSYLKDEQYKSQTFQQQLYPDSLFFVKQGDEIGRMGNSGRSFGPHLHFEIRETSTEIPINPFLFGIKPTDKRPPVFQSVRFYDSDSISVKNNILEKAIIKKAKGKYSLDTNLVILDSDIVGLSVQIYDQMDGAYNKNGVYQMKVLIDNMVQHGFTMDKVSYKDGHYINAHIDYGEKQKSKRQFSNCFTYPVDQLSIYAHPKDRTGIIKLSKEKPTDIKIVLQDYHGNVSELIFQLQASANERVEEVKIGNYVIQNERRNIIRLASADIIFKENTFLKDLKINVNESLEITDGIRLPSFTIDDSSNPIFKPFKLYIKGLNIPDSLKAQFMISKCENEKRIAYQGEWKDSLYIIKLDELGTYQCEFDYKGPEIQIVNLQKDMSKQSSIKLKIKDDYEPGSKALRLKYDATIDGDWVLFEYDLKNDLIIYLFDEKCQNGKHILNLSVKDSRNNESTLRFPFSKF